jgi:hypothetical protein
MFYGIPPDKVPKLQHALDTLHELYTGQVFATDMLIVMWRNLTFLQNQRFMDSAWGTAENEQEKSLLWRLHVLAWAGECALRVPGDFVECGVLRGYSSAVVCKYLDFAEVPKTFYLYDTFSGPVERLSTPEERRSWSIHPDLQDPARLLERVRQSFSAYPNVTIVPGAVPDSFAQAIPETIAYLHIDMNSARAEVLALEQLYDRVSPGGMIVLDDFGWSCNREQTVAELEFMKRRNQPILELPTGQGLVVKLPR